MRKIGRFDIRRELGKGAQSVVYLGYDPRLQREVAIKTLARVPASGALSLLDEARTVSRLRHPHIVPVFEAGEEGDALFLVFEYVPGKSLAEFLKTSGALPQVHAINLLQPVLEALAHAHAQGIIHRDLKPSNILLDEDGTPRVMDFGIAAQVDAPAAEASTDAQHFSGTPAYMAPEYITRHVVSESGDVFAAGLILYELLTGQRAVEGGQLHQVLHRIANTDLRLPDSGPAIDERLASIVHKALARDPELRYQSIRQFADALEAFLNPEDDGRLHGEGRQATLDFLMRRMRHKSDFPALSESVSAINKIASSETESINTLSNLILKDFALTNKMLRLVNSAYFRPAGGGAISTVSRAVIVLGFEAVRNIAITVLLFEHLQNKANANQLKEDFLRANMAGILARKIGAAAHMRDVEQTFICALFHNLGRLLSQFYFPEESDEVRRQIAQRQCTEDQAALSVLGISFEDLGIEVARQWGFPVLIVQAMRRLPAGPVKKANTSEERLRVLADMSSELCAIIAASGQDHGSAALHKLAHRFHEAVPLDAKDLRETVCEAFEEVGEFARIIHLHLAQTAFGRQVRQFAVGGGHAGDFPTEKTVDTGVAMAMLGQPDPLGYVVESGTDESGEGKLSAQDILTAGIQDISNTLVDGFKLNDILRIILETMYRAIGFKRVILCIKDPRSHNMRGRFGFGPEADAVAKRFEFPLAFAPDVFHAATAKGADILINDIDDPQISGRVPAWFRAAVPAHAFVLFPLNIKGNPVAMIYADKDEAGSIVLPEKELSLLRTLRNQAVLAIKQGG